MFDVSDIYKEFGFFDDAIIQFKLSVTFTHNRKTAVNNNKLAVPSKIQSISRDGNTFSGPQRLAIFSTTSSSLFSPFLLHSLTSVPLH